MNDRQTVVETYLEGFRRSDRDRILSCLTDDVVWELPGFKHLEGKDAFESEIENENFAGSPRLDVDRMIEDGDVVVAIGTGTSTRTSGTVFKFAFCDVFTFAGERIAHVESYVVPVTAPDEH